MQELPDLKTISSEDKDILIGMLWKELQILKGLQSQQQAKIEELETSKGKIKKTSKNSSQPRRRRSPSERKSRRAGSRLRGTL
jgi:hypothetical protein